jgi:mono/diheme cytochrome c family protein
MILSKLIIGVTLFFSYSFHFSEVNNFEYFDIPKNNQQKITLEKSIANGKEIYSDYCVQCHGANGKGDSTNFPPLAGSDWIDNKITQSIHAIKFGLSGEIKVNGKKFNNAMPPSVGLSSQEIADVFNYVRNSWGNKHPKIITAVQVEKVKQ